MARTERHRLHDREAVAEMPDWLKVKHCPHKKKYMAGKRIMPKNLTGKEKLAHIVDEVFLAYNSARLKEACQLFANNMLAAIKFYRLRTNAGLEEAKAAIEAMRA